MFTGLTIFRRSPPATIFGRLCKGLKFLADYAKVSLGSGCRHPWPRGITYPQGYDSRFQSHASFIPLPQAWLGALQRSRYAIMALIVISACNHQIDPIPLSASEWHFFKRIRVSLRGERCKMGNYLFSLSNRLSELLCAYWIVS